MRDYFPTLDAALRFYCRMWTLRGPIRCRFVRDRHYYTAVCLDCQLLFEPIAIPPVQVEQVLVSRQDTLRHFGGMAIALQLAHQLLLSGYMALRHLDMPFGNVEVLLPHGSVHKTTLVVIPIVML